MAKIPDTLKERVSALEVGMRHMCDSLDAIKLNDLRHLDAKIDKLDDKVVELDKKVEVMAVKVGLIVAVFTTIAQAFIKISL